MNDSPMTHQELIEKISILERKIKELEQLESARKRAEEALQRSEERYRTLVENATDLVFRTDNTGRLTFVNPATLRITGYEEKEIIGQPYTMVIRPDMRDKAMKFFGRQFVKRIQNTYSEYPMLTKDGREVWFGQNTQLIVEDDHVTGFQVMARDITERKRIEEELRDSEERYRRIVETSSDAVLLRSKDNIVIYSNPAALKLFRADHPEDLIGKQYLDMVHPDDRAISAERVKKTMNENWIASPREHRMLALDGQVVNVESTGVPIQYRGKAHIFGIFRDITERKRTELEINTLANIGRIISSTPDIDEVYERFAETVRKIIPFDRIVINTIDVEMNSVTNVYMAGHGIADRKVGVSYPLKGSGNFEMVHTNSSLLIQTENFDEYQDRFPMLLSTFQAGFRSIMNIPIFSKGEIVGGLLLRSFKPYAYTDHEMKLAERVGNQIAGTIVNAQLFAGLKKAQQGLKESEQRYRELSIVDDLTQLYNSRYFYHQLKAEMERSNRYEQPLTLLLLDLDDFKAFNDTYGHVEGDHVLLRLGQVVRRRLRQTDSAYRYGGEEFTILLPMTTRKDGAVTAERIRTELRKEIFSPAPGREVHLTVSVGIGQYRPQEEMKAFVHRVDQLMYQGKNNGKDRVCSEP